MKKEELATSNIVIEWEETGLNKPIRLKRNFDTLINVFNILRQSDIDLVDQSGQLNFAGITKNLSNETIRSIMFEIVWNLAEEDLSKMSIEEGGMIVTSFFQELIKNIMKVSNTFTKTIQK